MSKYSDEVRRSCPYLLPLIEKAIRNVSTNGGGGGGGSGVGGAPSPHAMASSHHTGSITAAQGPLFLLSDGTRPLTGHLDVDPGIQIDGVDISVHQASPDVHHARATAGNTGISLSGQAISLFLNSTASGLQISSGLMLADSIAGNGLGISGKVLAVNTGNGIEVASDAVAVDLATLSGLTFVSGDLALGEPDQLTVNTLDQVTASSHSHSILSDSNVGSGSVNEAILRSTPTGGLRLNSLEVTGALDVLNYGDLTVGNNVLFVMNLEDEVSGANNSRVGIMRAPDPQFALDVNGPIRGTELVGHHAIQLDDIALLLHFDGGHPYETNYRGEPNAIPMGVVPTENTLHLYRPGQVLQSGCLWHGGHQSDAQSEL